MPGWVARNFRTTPTPFSSVSGGCESSGCVGLASNLHFGRQSRPLPRRKHDLCGSIEPRRGAGRAPHVSAGVSRFLPGNECPRDQAGRARHARGAAPLPARIGTLHRFVRFRAFGRGEQIEGSDPGPFTATWRTLFAVITLWRSAVGARPLPSSETGCALSASKLRFFAFRVAHHEGGICLRCSLEALFLHPARAYCGMGELAGGKTSVPSRVVSVAGLRSQIVAG